MHISDLHFDFQYKEGAPAKCNEPVCCREGKTPLNDSFSAGKYGSLSNCDIPTATMDLFL